MNIKLQNAIKLAQESKFSEAKELLEKLLKDSPDNAEILYNHGMCYSELGNPDKAIETLKKREINALGFANLNVALGFAPEQDVRMDFSEEYRMAQEFY
jgi:tetratricopeptide (TPR) repeat protein